MKVRAILVIALALLLTGCATSASAAGASGKTKAKFFIKREMRTSGIGTLVFGKAVAPVMQNHSKLCEVTNADRRMRDAEVVVTEESGFVFIIPKVKAKVRAKGVCGQ